MALLTSRVSPLLSGVGLTLTLLMLSTASALAQGYTYSDLYNLGSSTGYDPEGIILENGVFYGTTNGGYYGTVFSITPTGNGNYTGATLFNFNGADGADTSSGLIADSHGNFYGTTTSGVAPQNTGVMFVRL